VALVAVCGHGFFCGLRLVRWWAVEIAGILWLWLPAAAAFVVVVVVVVVIVVIVVVVVVVVDTVVVVIMIMVVVSSYCGGYRGGMYMCCK